jgi:4-amino-4-deoxy-L-arabinose transferase-like glycosyltransferase
MLSVYALGRRVYGESGGVYAAAILGTAFGTFLFTRILIPDIITGLWITLGLHFFRMTLEEERPSRLTCWGFAAAAALGVLTKGLIA